MIRLVKYYRYDCVLLIGHEKFSILEINDPLIYGSLKEDYYFEGHDNIHIFNSGEKEIELLVKSEEEMQNLSYTLECWGFTVKSHWIFPGSPKKRSLIDSKPSDFKPVCSIIIRLYRKDFKKFQELIKELSEKSNYKTLYRPGILK